MHRKLWPSTISDMSILTHIASQWVLACFVLVDQSHAFCAFAHVWLLFMVVCFGSSWTFKGSDWLPHSHSGPVGPLCLQLPISWQAEGAVLWLAALGLTFLAWHAAVRFVLYQ